MKKNIAIVLLLSMHFCAAAQSRVDTFHVYITYPPSVNFHTRALTDMVRYYYNYKKQLQNLVADSLHAVFLPENHTDTVIRQQKIREARETKSQLERADTSDIMRLGLGLLAKLLSASLNKAYYPGDVLPLVDSFFYIKVMEQLPPVLHSNEILFQLEEIKTIPVETYFAIQFAMTSYSKKDNKKERKPLRASYLDKQKPGSLLECDPKDLFGCLYANFNALLLREAMLFMQAIQMAPIYPED